jgi:CDGSH-type Zn-finger protein
MVKDKMDSRTEKIIVKTNGPYLVQGGVPLVRKAPVISEHGEPLTWKKGESLQASEPYSLCRCGQSDSKPFCDGSHADVDFDGMETADTRPMADRETTYKGTGINVLDDRSICVHAGFCGTRITNAWKMVRETGDTQVRAQVMAMIERCPSGALSYTLEPASEVLEPDLPREVAIIPDGPLWISGGVPVERADGLAFETRNRVTLCRCGASNNKPLCDGSHKEVGFQAK